MLLLVGSVGQVATMVILGFCTGKALVLELES